MSIEEMEAIDVVGYWSEPRQRAAQPGREPVPHLCSRCLTTLERHAGDGVAATFWCPGCGSAGSKLTEMCACGISRAGVVLRCAWLPGEDGGPGEIAVVEPEAPVVALPASGARGAAAN